MKRSRLLAGILCVISAFIILPFAASISAAQDRTERISFSGGRSSKTVRGDLVGYEGVTYLVGASAGQRLAVSMRTNNGSNYFNVWAPGASEAMFIGSSSGDSFDVILPSSGDYRIQVYLMRNAARRGEAADYALTVAVTGGDRGGGGGSRQPDYADGLSGGPDFWRVANVPRGDTLNIRVAPSSKARVIARLRNGTILRNGGCRLNGQTRWCLVETPDGRAGGWVSGRFLVEAGG